MLDLDKATDDQLANLADLAFRRGLSDGRVKSTPLTAEYLMKNLIPANAYRRLHTHKLRQIYGAGFDIGTMQRRFAVES